MNKKEFINLKPNTELFYAAIDSKHNLYRFQTIRFEKSTLKWEGQWSYDRHTWIGYAEHYPYFFVDPFDALLLWVKIRYGEL